IIIDDGSTDGSLEILRHYAQRDTRIVLITRPNRGLVPTLNEGLERVRGEYVMRMDADDLSRPKRMETQIVYLQSHPEVVAVGCALNTMDAAGLPVGKFVYPEDHTQIDAAHL